jgi:hypothetical protein
MQSTVEIIKDLLKNYHFYRIQVVSGYAGEQLKERLHFLENLLKVFYEDDYKLVKQIYLEKLPVAKVARNYYCARGTVYNRCEKAIRQIAKIYENTLV